MREPSSLLLLLVRGKSAAQISALSPITAHPAPWMPRTGDSTPPNGGGSPTAPLLGEEFLDLLHPGLGAGVVSLAVSLADHLELAQQLPLSVGQVHWRFDDDVAEQVAVFPTAHAANALAAQPKCLPGLGLRGDSDLRRAVQRGNFDFSAERCRSESDRHLAVQVVVVSLKNGMGLDLDLHVKIA